MSAEVSPLLSFQHNFSRWLYRLRRRKKVARLEALRYGEGDSTYTLKPFDDSQCIFVRVPKTASQSVSRGLFGNLAGSHRSIEGYRKFYTAEEFYSYFKFCFVRNPWDRMVSTYTYHTTTSDPENSTWAAKNISHFADFNEFAVEWLTEENINSGLQHYRPQVEFITDRNGKIAVDFVGYFERLADDFERVASRLDIDSRLDHLNKTPGREKIDYRSYYNDKTAEIVGKLYSRDIEMLGYSFDQAAPVNAIK